MSSTKRTRDQHVHAFLRKLLSGEYEKKIFDRLSKQGFPSDRLGELLFSVSTLAALEASSAQRRNDVQRSDLKDLPERAESLASLVEHANRTPWSPLKSIVTALRGHPSAPRDWQMRAKLVGDFYRMLPGILRVYAAHFNALRQASRSLRQSTLTRRLTLELLGDVKHYTGYPRYEAIANLLTKGFEVAGGPEHSIPRCFGEAALTKLYQRSGKLRPRRGRLPMPD
jgi:hypothetical protein